MRTTLEDEPLLNRPLFESNFTYNNIKTTLHREKEKNYAKNAQMNMLKAEGVEKDLWKKLFKNNYL